MRISYDLAGNRTSDIACEQVSGKALQETVNNYVYDDLHRLDSFSISQSGKATQSGQILCDGAGRQVYAKTLSSTGEAERRYNQYDTQGRVQDTRVVMRRADNQSRIQHNRKSLSEFTPSQVIPTFRKFSSSLIMQVATADNITNSYYTMDLK
ncbi:hypothetical protein [Delftia acidovorans]|uniref:hypothetical protein n=1 Tax=Delftia acidovorans TaxID=80866 RepID=UPI00192B5DAF|nr:hypothetical protein [Delftia acidovorans]